MDIENYGQRNFVLQIFYWPPPSRGFSRITKQTNSDKQIVLIITSSAFGLIPKLLISDSAFADFIYGLLRTGTFSWFPDQSTVLLSSGSCHKNVEFLQHFHEALFENLKIVLSYGENRGFVMHDKFRDILFITFSLFNEKNNHYFLVDFAVKTSMNLNRDLSFEWLTNPM